MGDTSENGQKTRLLKQYSKNIDNAATSEIQ